MGEQAERTPSDAVFCIGWMWCDRSDIGFMVNLVQRRVRGLRAANDAAHVPRLHSPAVAASLELDGLPRLGGTDAGGWFEAAPCVVVAVPRPGYVQTEAGARASLQELRRISQEHSRRFAVIVLVDRVASQDAASRRVWSRELTSDDVCSLALVCRSLLGRAIGSFFLGLHRLPVPTEMFATWDEALGWSLDRLANRAS